MISRKISGSASVLIAVSLFATMQLWADDIICTEPNRNAGLLVQINPGYPYLAQMLCIEGHLTSEFTIQSDGSVTNIALIESEPPGIFDAEIRAIRYWKFMPRCIDGKAVDQNAIQTIDFELDDAYGYCTGNDSEKNLEFRLRLVALYRQVAGRIEDLNGRLQTLPVETRFDEPFASIERVHLRYLNKRLKLEHRWRSNSIRGIHDALAPGNLDGEPSLDELLSRIDTTAGRRSAAYLEWVESKRSLSEDLNALGESSEFDKATRVLLIDPHARALNQGIEPDNELLSLEKAALAKYRALIQWLIEHRKRWKLAGQEIRVSGRKLARQYEKLREAAMEAFHAWEEIFHSPQGIYWPGILGSVEKDNQKSLQSDRQ